MQKQEREEREEKEKRKWDQATYPVSLLLDCAAGVLAAEALPGDGHVQAPVVLLAEVLDALEV